MSEDYFTRTVRDAEDRYVPAGSSPTRTAMMAGGGVLILFGVLLLFPGVGSTYGAGAALVGFLVSVLGVGLLIGGVLGGYRVPAHAPSVVNDAGKLPADYILRADGVTLVGRTPVVVDGVTETACWLRIGGESHVVTDTVVIAGVTYDARVIDGALELRRAA